MFPISNLHNKILILVDFEPKNFGRFFRFSANFRPNFFCSKSAEMKILLCKVDMGNKLYEVKFFELCSKKIELMKQIHLLKIGFVIFLKGATFSDFIYYSLLNYIPSGIQLRSLQIHFPLFWGILVYAHAVLSNMTAEYLSYYHWNNL